MKLDSINESITIYRYDNGFMVESSGEATIKKGETQYVTNKQVCNTEKDVLALVGDLFKITLVK